MAMTVSQNEKFSRGRLAKARKRLSKHIKKRQYASALSQSQIIFEYCLGLGLLYWRHGLGSPNTMFQDALQAVRNALEFNLLAVDYWEKERRLEPGSKVEIKMPVEKKCLDVDCSAAAYLSILVEDSLDHEIYAMAPDCSDWNNEDQPNLHELVSRLLLDLMLFERNSDCWEDIINFLSRHRHYRISKKLYLSYKKFIDALHKGDLDLGLDLIHELDSLNLTRSRSEHFSGLPAYDGYSEDRFVDFRMAAIIRYFSNRSDRFDLRVPDHLVWPIPQD